MTSGEHSGRPAPGKDSTPEYMLTLIEQSLKMWRILARAHRESDGAIVVRSLGHKIRIRCATSGLPFRWMVSVDGKERPALSIIAVLRHVRSALDPAFKPVRIRIAPLPLEGD